MTIKLVKFSKQRQSNAKIAWQAACHENDVYTPENKVVFSMQFDNLNAAQEWFDDQLKASGINISAAPDSVKFLKWLKQKHQYTEE